MPPELRGEEEEDEEEEDEEAYPINNNQNFRARPYSSKPTFQDHRANFQPPQSS